MKNRTWYVKFVTSHSTRQINVSKEFRVKSAEKQIIQLINADLEIRITLMKTINKKT